MCLFFLLQSFFSQLSAFAWRKARQTLRKLQVEHAKQNVKRQTHQFCGRLSVLLAHDGTDEEAKERMKRKNEVAHLPFPPQIGCSCTFQIGVLQFISVARIPPVSDLYRIIRYNPISVLPRKVMADEEDRTCPYCEQDLSAMVHRGRQTHIGFCRRDCVDTRGRTRAERRNADDAGAAPASPEPVGHFPAASSSNGDATDDDDEGGDVGFQPLPAPLQPLAAAGAETHPFATDADWELAKLIVTHDSLPRGTLDRLLAIFAMGGLTFQSTYAVLKSIDELPGRSFSKTTVHLAPIPDIAYVAAHGPFVPYELYHRPLLHHVLDSLVNAVPGHFFDAAELPEEGRERDHLVSADAYQELLRDLRHATDNPTAVLIPLVFHSGACHYHATSLVHELRFVRVMICSFLVRASAFIRENSLRLTIMCR